MEMSVQDAMSTAMWRFHDAALERAALIYTFARSTHEDVPPAYTLYPRQLVMLIDIVHEFCFNARRAIERDEKYRPGVIAGAQALHVHHGRTELSLSEIDNPARLPLTQESFWWVMGRIIHSRETQVMYRTVDIVVTNQTTGRHHSIRQPVAFGFSSDKDPNSMDHYVELEALALGYVGSIAHLVEEAVKTRNGPAVS